jgi:hypothetical protein
MSANTSHETKSGFAKTLWSETHKELPNGFDKREVLNSSIFSNKGEVKILSGRNNYFVVKFREIF